jgi:hypothetical protein
LVASSSRIKTHLDRNRVQANSNVYTAEKANLYAIWKLFDWMDSQFHLTSPHIFWNQYTGLAVYNSFSWPRFSERTSGRSTYPSEWRPWLRT